MTARSPFALEVLAVLKAIVVHEVRGRALRPLQFDASGATCEDAGREGSAVADASAEELRASADPQAALCALHTDAIGAYLRREFDVASAGLKKVREMQAPAEDVAAALIQERCEYLRGEDALGTQSSCRSAQAGKRY